MYKFYNWRLQHPTASGGGGSDSTQGAGAEGAQGADDGDEDGGSDEAGDDGDSESSKPVTMTQGELDALINRAFKRGARKGAKDNRAQAAPPPADDGQGEGDDGKASREAAEQAAKKLAEASAKLLAATVKSNGADMAISTKGLKVAERVIDLDDCVGADGEIDEEAVVDALEEFIKEYPEFKTGGGKKPGVKQFEGNPKGSGPKMTKDEIMKIKDPAKRRKAIADNISLFQ